MARGVRTAAALLALALALTSMLRQRALAARQEQMAAWLASAGVPAPRELPYEPDPGRVDLRAARAVLAAELDPARRQELPHLEPAGENEPGAPRLAAATRLAGAVLAERPAAWDAAMVLGTATYLSLLRARDTRLFSAAASWERPLETAISLAPGRPDAARLLAGAYLELWLELSPHKRQRERQLLSGLFADPAYFSALIGPWLAAAASRDEALSVIPPNPELWTRLQQLYAQHGDWQGFCAARARWDRTLQAHLAVRLGEAEQQRAGGRGRDLFLEVASEARPGRRYLTLLNRALEDCPPGSVDRRTAERLAKQLTWSLERCSLDRCPLSPRALRRLAGFCRDLDPRTDAMAAVLTGDLPRAEALERNYATPGSEDWIPFRLLEAKELAARGRGREAAAALAGFPASWLARPTYWLVRGAAARATGDAAAEAAAGRELARLEKREWPSTAWDFRGGVARLELLAAAGASGLALTVDVAPPHGAAVEVRLDDSTLGAFPVTSGALLALPAAVAPGPHLLELESLAGGPCLPGAVRLAAGDGGGREPN